MAWPGVPSSLSTPQPMDMKMYELTEHLRTMQIVQAEQSRRLDEQSYRIHQLEMKDFQTNRLESQRYLWGPGAVGSTVPAPPVVKPLSGLGFEVFSPTGKEKERAVGCQDGYKGNGILMDEPTKDPIETDIDNLLISPTSTPREPPPDTTGDPPTTTLQDPPSRAQSQSPILQPPNNPPGNNTYFPYVLNIQCWLPSRIDRPPPTSSELLTAQINTSVHASFIDSALIHHLGITHRIRTRRPPRYAQSRTPGATAGGGFHAPTPRPRILLPVYFPLDPTTPASTTESQVAKCQIDFVVVATHDLTPLEHQKYTALEIGAQALFLHGMDVLFSARVIRIGGLNVPLPQVAPRDQKRLLSSIALAPFVAPQPSWDRLRRNTVTKQEDQGESAETWGGGVEEALLRDTSTNSSFSSTSAVFQGSATTGMTSPAMTEVDSLLHTGMKETENGLPTPPLTAGVFTSALQFIPSSVVVVARKPEETRSRSVSIAEQEEEQPPLHLNRSRSQSSQEDNTSLPPLDPPGLHLHSLSTPADPTPPLESPNPLDSISSPPTRPSSLLTDHQIPSRKSSLRDPTTTDPFDGGPRFPTTLIDTKPTGIQRKPSSTWPRSLGKKIAPWTSVDATKTSILGTAFDQDTPPTGAAGAGIPPARKMKILKPVRKGGGVGEAAEGGCGEVIKVDVVRDVVRMEVNGGEEVGKGQVASGKNVGGGAFHWMK